MFELHAAGKTRVIQESRSLGDVNEAIADVEAGRVPARIVFTPESRLYGAGPLPSGGQIIFT